MPKTKVIRDYRTYKHLEGERIDHRETWIFDLIDRHVILVEWNHYTYVGGYYAAELWSNRRYTWPEYTLQIFKIGRKDILPPEVPDDVYAEARSRYVLDGFL
jgi:hypothetical protein